MKSHTAGRGTKHSRISESVCAFIGQKTHADHSKLKSLAETENEDTKEHNS